MYQPFITLLLTITLTYNIQGMSAGDIKTKVAEQHIAYENDSDLFPSSAQLPAPVCAIIRYYLTGSLDTEEAFTHRKNVANLFQEDCHEGNLIYFTCNPAISTLDIPETENNTYHVLDLDKRTMTQIDSAPSSEATILEVSRQIELGDHKLVLDSNNQTVSCTHAKTSEQTVLELPKAIQAPRIYPFNTDTALILHGKGDEEATYAILYTPNEPGRHWHLQAYINSKPVENHRRTILEFKDGNFVRESLYRGHGDVAFTWYDHQAYPLLRMLSLITQLKLTKLLEELCTRTKKLKATKKALELLPAEKQFLETLPKRLQENIMSHFQSWWLEK